MALLFLFGPVFGLVCFVLGVFFTRWVFKVNKIVRTLESIDESLQFLPAVQVGRKELARRLAA